MAEQAIPLRRTLLANAVVLAPSWGALVILYGVGELNGRATLIAMAGIAVLTGLLVQRYLGSLEAIGIDTSLHDIRFVEADWESPTLGAWGLGWEVWCDGMEITQFTYFQQVGGIEVDMVAGEITYGLERLAMYLFDKKTVYELPFNRTDSEVPLTYGDVFLQNEREQSAYNFEHADTQMLFRHFADAEKECASLVAKKLPLPAYEQCIKASHAFNLLDARGVISVTERQSYILRVRDLAKACCEAWLATQIAKAA